MKRRISAVLLFLPLLTFAQSYTFSVRQEPYHKLENAVLQLPAGEMQNWSLIRATMRMPFYLFGNKVDTFYIHSKGFMIFNVSDGPGTCGISPCAAQTSERYSEWPDLYSSNIGIKVDSIDSKRVVKVEYDNIGFQFVNDPDTTNFFNMQVWLYEESNIIEFHYGPSKTDAANWFQSYTGPYASIDSADMVIYNITGDPANPVISGNNTLNLNDFPVSGTVYRFTPAFTTGIKEIGASVAFSLYPNPAQQYVTISIENAGKNKPKAILMDMQGRKVKTIDMAGESSVRMPLDDLLPGMYFVKVETSSGTSTRKLLVR